MFFKREGEERIAKRGILNAAGAIVYIGLVAALMTNIDKILGPGPDTPNVFAPMAFLSLLVLSVAVMATLVFGKPAMLYMDGKKQEALTLVGWTIGAFAVLTVGAFLLLASAQ